MSEQVLSEWHLKTPIRAVEKTEIISYLNYGNWCLNWTIFQKSELIKPLFLLIEREL